MTRFGHAQVLGFSEDVCKALASVRESLMRAGVDADAIGSMIRAQHEQVADLNAQQESQKRQLSETTAKYEAAKDRLYVMSSGALDTAMAGVTKTSSAAKNLQRLRSRIRKPKGNPEVLPVTK